MTAQRTTLGHQCNLTGDLVLDGDTVFLGRLEGTLRSDGPVEIGGSATIHGIVDAPSVRLAGRVEGEVIGSRKVTLLGGSHVVGQINTSRFEVAAGASFEGVASLDEPHHADIETQPIAAQAYLDEMIDEPSHDDDEEKVEGINVILQRRRVKPRRAGPRSVGA